MKKISAAFLAIVVTFFFVNTLNIYAVNDTEHEDYSINFELFSETDEAEIFNEHKDEILSYFNGEIKRWRKAADKPYSYLEIEDIDFTNNNKISCVKVNGDYSDFRQNVDLNTFLKSIDPQEAYWQLTATKEQTVYYGYIFPPNCTVGDTQYYKDNGIIIDEWVIYFRVQTVRGVLTNTKLAYQTTDGNLRDMLDSLDEPCRDITVILTSLYYCNTKCYIVFADGKAKYIYCYSLAVPYENMREDTPEYIVNLCKNFNDNCFMNFYHENTKIRKLYPYNTVISLFKACKQFSD